MARTSDSHKGLGGLGRRLKQILTLSCLNPEESKRVSDRISIKEMDSYGATDSMDEYHRWFADTDGYNCSTVRVPAPDTVSSSPGICTARRSSADKICNARSPKSNDCNCGHYLVIGCLKSFPGNMMLIHPDAHNPKQICCQGVGHSCPSCPRVADPSLSRSDDPAISYIRNNLKHRVCPSQASDPTSVAVRRGYRDRAAPRCNGFVSGVRNIHALSPEKSTLQCNGVSQSASELTPSEKVRFPVMERGRPSLKSTIFAGRPNAIQQKPNQEIWDDDFEFPLDDSLEVPFSLYSCQTRVRSNSANLKRFAAATKSIARHLASLEDLSPDLLLKNPFSHCKIIQKYGDTITDAIKIVKMDSLPFDPNEPSPAKKCPSKPPATAPDTLDPVTPSSVFSLPRYPSSSSHHHRTQEHTSSLGIASRISPQVSPTSTSSTYEPLANVSKCDDVLAGLVVFASRLNRRLASCVSEMKSSLAQTTYAWDAIADHALPITR